MYQVHTGTILYGTVKPLFFLNVIIKKKDDKMILLFKRLITIIVVLTISQKAVVACQICFQPAVALRHRRANHQRNLPSIVQDTFKTKKIVALTRYRNLNLCKLNKNATVFLAICGMATIRYLTNNLLESGQTSDEENKTGKGVNDNDEMDERSTSSDVSSSAMISTIGIYKNFISPLLPPACRFVPTCSQYGVDALKEFGSYKGVILISWRLLRCSPFGGKGYDPPKWPPVPYQYSSY